MRGAVQLALHAEYLHLPATHDVHVATPRLHKGCNKVIGNVSVLKEFVCAWTNDIGEATTKLS